MNIDCNCAASMANPRDAAQTICSLMSSDSLSVITGFRLSLFWAGFSSLSRTTWSFFFRSIAILEHVVRGSVETVDAAVIV